MKIYLFAAAAGIVFNIQLSGAVNGSYIYLEGDDTTTPALTFAAGLEEKFLWHPEKLAFRAGNYSFTSTAVNNFGVGSFAFAGGVASGGQSFSFGSAASSSGYRSFSFGDVYASGSYSFSMGRYVELAGDHSIGMGDVVELQGNHSVILGGNYSYVYADEAIVIGSNSSSYYVGGVAIGRSNYALAMDAQAFGYFTQSKSRRGMVIGQYNDPISTVNDDDSADRPLFIIGNGLNYSNPSNAFVVTADGKAYADYFIGDGSGLTGLAGGQIYASSGNVGIGTASPDAKLTVEDGAFLVTGTTGSTPVSGEGARLMWVPEKFAFRAGMVVDESLSDPFYWHGVDGTELWNDANIGDGSFSVGVTH